MAAGGRNRPTAAPDLRAATPTDRHEPRVRTRRPKNYPLTTNPRAELIQALSGQRLKPYLRAIRGWHLFPLLGAEIHAGNGNHHHGITHEKPHGSKC